MIGRKDLILPAGIAALLLAVFLGLDFDLGLNRLFFDPAAGAFPLEHHPLLEKLLHDDVKQAVRQVVALMGLAAFASLLLQRLRAHRRLLFFVVAATLLSAATVSAIKKNSYQSCPVNLTEFGGNRPYIGPFDPVPPGAIHGRCSPGGHAASAFSLFPLYLAARHLRRKRLATGTLWFVMAFGLLLTLVQVARGMHLFSHQIWTALLCWYVSLAAYWLFFPKQGAEARASPAPGAKLLSCTNGTEILRT